MKSVLWTCGDSLGPTLGASFSIGKSLLYKKWLRTPPIPLQAGGMTKMTLFFFSSHYFQKLWPLCCFSSMLVLRISRGRSLQLSLLGNRFLLYLSNPLYIRKNYGIIWDIILCLLKNINITFFLRLQSFRKDWNNTLQINFIMSHTKLYVFERAMRGKILYRKLVRLFWHIYGKL